MDPPDDFPDPSDHPDADIDAPQAWDEWVGDPNFRIAVIDTGIDYNHPDLAANIWINPCEDHEPLGVIGPEDFDGSDDERCPGNPPNGYVDDIAGYNFLNNNGNARDLDGHGTYGAGIIGAVGNNGVGVAGVNWQCKLVALKAGDSAGVLLSAAADAVDYCVANGIKLSNNSYGTQTNLCARDCDEGSCTNGCQLLFTAIKNAQAAGHLFVASAGNVTPSNPEPNNDILAHYPDGFELPNIISVMATNNDDQIWNDHNGMSHYGAESVDLGAPGATVYSTRLGGGYKFDSGTSAAAPHVTGVAALLWSRYPQWDWNQVHARVLDTTRGVGSLVGKTATGGVVNAFRAVFLDCNDNGLDDECDIDCAAQEGACNLPGCGASPDCFTRESNCCVEHAGAGCDDPAIAECVCELAPACCSGEWSAFCVIAAAACEATCAPAPDALPDECQPSPDCNGNDVPDACDLTCTDPSGVCTTYNCGLSPDCNDNCIPDECDLTSGRSADCNENGVPDECDIAAETGCDFDGNGVPDECAACCELVPGGCRNALPGKCTGKSWLGLTCAIPGQVGEPRTCQCASEAACCYDDGCRIERDCKCVADGRYVDPMATSCDSVECDRGACCTGEICQDDIPYAECEDPNTYIGGADCGPPNPCAELPEPIEPPREDLFVADTGRGTRNRYLAFVPPLNAGPQIGLRVTFTAMPDSSANAEGWTMWVQEPKRVTEVSGETGPKPVPNFWAAKLDCAPYSIDWAAYGTLHVYGEKVVPSRCITPAGPGTFCDSHDWATYMVQAVHETEGTCSPPISVSMSGWGDIVGGFDVDDCQTTARGYLDCWTGPDGDIDFDDIDSVVDKFLNLPGAPQKSRADISPCSVDFWIDFSDIPAVVDAYLGMAYPCGSLEGCP